MFRLCVDNTDILLHQWMFCLTAVSDSVTIFGDVWLVWLCGKCQVFPLSYCLIVSVKQGFKGQRPAKL